jgi:protocatechuate 3,4-dioxygenase alpha subunit
VKYIPSASQTVGPFFNFGLTTNPKLGIIAGPETPGERIRLTFRVIEGDGAPTPGDAMIEIWQADAAGRYAHPLDGDNAAGEFHGFGRLETDLEGRCTFETIRPGCVAAPDGRLQAPHLNVTVFARGLLKHLHTRVYFEGDPANDADPVLGLVPQERRATLLARQVEGDPPEWRFDLVLQGEGETVFFDL